MKALLLKDTYVIWKQMKIFLIIILVFSAIPSGFNSAFAVIYAAMMPYTAMAYDERSKWDQMAAMMPYSTRDIVLGKYVFGWLCITAAAVLSALLQGLLSFLGTNLSPVLLAMSVLGALCVLAITLPVMFRFGVEKGRLAMFLLIFLVCGTAGGISSISISEGSGATFAFQNLILPLLVVAAVVLTAVSVPLSMRFYRERMG